MASVLGNIANVLTEMGDLDAALEKFQEASTVFNDIGNKWGQAKSLCNMAVVLELKGDLGAAKRNYQQSLAISRGGEKRGRSYCLIGLGGILMGEGDLGKARESFQEALALAKESGDKRSQAVALSRFGGLLRAEGNLRESRNSQEEALAIRNGLGEKRTVAESHAFLSELAVDEGRLGQAEDLARQAVEECRGDRGEDIKTTAQHALATALLAQAKLAEAQSAVADATAMLANSQSPRRLAVAITQARVQAAIADPGSAQTALRTLRGIIAQSTKAGLIGYQLEGRLALGEIEMKLGKSSRARRWLESVEKDAKAKGFGLIAMKAAAAARGKPNAFSQ